MSTSKLEGMLKQPNAIRVHVRHTERRRSICRIWLHVTLNWSSKLLIYFVVQINSVSEHSIRWQEVEFLCTAALLLDPRHLKLRYRRGLARIGSGMLHAAASGVYQFCIDGVSILRISTQDFYAVLTMDPDCHDAKAELEDVYKMIEAADEDDEDFAADDLSDDDFPSIDHPAKEFDEDSESGTSG